MTRNIKSTTLRMDFYKRTKKTYQNGGRVNWLAETTAQRQGCMNKSPANDRAAKFPVGIRSLHAYWGSSTEPPIPIPTAPMKPSPYATDSLVRSASIARCVGCQLPMAEDLPCSSVTTSIIALGMIARYAAAGPEDAHACVRVHRFHAWRFTKVSR